VGEIGAHAEAGHLLQLKCWCVASEIKDSDMVSVCANDDMAGSQLAVLQRAHLFRLTSLILSTLCSSKATQASQRTTSTTPT
jgi:hypothetical protein